MLVFLPFVGNFLLNLFKIKIINQDEVKLDSFGCVQLQHGDKEIRFEQAPFPLYPGEELLGKIEKLKVVRKDQAFRLLCLEDFDDDGTERLAGDEWLLQGPKTYMPRKARILKNM